jgi:hypothetical protein
MTSGSSPPVLTAASRPLRPQQRTPVVFDPESKRLRIDEHVRRVDDPSQPNQVYGAYLALLYAVRGAKPGEQLPLRTADLEALLLLVGDDPETIEKRLIALMGCTADEAEGPRRHPAAAPQEDRGPGRRCQPAVRRIDRSCAGRVRLQPDGGHLQRRDEPARAPRHGAGEPAEGRGEEERGQHRCAEGRQAGLQAKADDLEVSITTAQQSIASLDTQNAQLDRDITAATDELAALTTRGASTKPPSRTRRRRWKGFNDEEGRAHRGADAAAGGAQGGAGGTGRSARGGGRCRRADRRQAGRHRRGEGRSGRAEAEATTAADAFAGKSTPIGTPRVRS